MGALGHMQCLLYFQKGWGLKARPVGGPVCLGHGAQ